MVTNVVTGQGRDHSVKIRSGCRSQAVVNVHFEPELTLRSLRERLRLITPHWPHYPDSLGVITGDFNICEPEEGRFNVFFPRVLEIAQPDFSRIDSAADGIIRTLSRIDRAFINLIMAEARDFHCQSHVLENLGGKDPNRAIMQLYVWLSINGLFVDIRANAFRVGCPNILFLLNFETNQRRSLIP